MSEILFPRSNPEPSGNGDRPNTESRANSLSARFDRQTDVANLSLRKAESQETLITRKRAALTKNESHLLSTILTRHGLQARMEAFQYAVLGAMNGNPLTSGLLSDNDPSREQILALCDEIASTLLSDPGWPIESVATVNATVLSNVRHIELVLHPFHGLSYGDGGSPSGWESAEKSFDRYFEQQIVEAAQVAYAAIKLDPQCLPDAYVFLLNATNEWNLLRVPPAHNSIRVFVLPRRVDSSKISQEILESMLSQNRSITRGLYIESEKSDNGTLTNGVAAALCAKLPPNTSISLRGGYLGHCMNGCMASLKQLTRKDLHFAVDEYNSTSPFFPYGNDVRQRKPQDRTPAVSIPGTIQIPPRAPQKLSDVQEWLKLNNDFNAKILRSLAKLFPSD